MESSERVTEIYKVVNGDRVKLSDCIQGVPKVLQHAIFNGFVPAAKANVKSRAL